MSVHECKANDMRRSVWRGGRGAPAEEYGSAGRRSGSARDAAHKSQASHWPEMVLGVVLAGYIKWLPN
jgi:hypothetical protein